MPTKKILEEELRHLRRENERLERELWECRHHKRQLLNRTLTLSVVMSTISDETLSGNVSAEAAAGEIVTITITRPDNTVDTITATTVADATIPTQGDFTAVYTPPTVGTYTAQADIPNDGTYVEALSAPVQFIVTSPLLPRTLSLSVSP